MITAENRIDLTHLLRLQYCRHHKLFGGMLARFEAEKASGDLNLLKYLAPELQDAVQLGYTSTELSTNSPSELLGS